MGKSDNSLNSKKRNIGVGEISLLAIKGIIVTVITICIAITAVVMLKPIYYFDVEYLDIPEKSGYTKEQCIENYDVLIDYNLIYGAEELEFPDMQMSENGRIHFEEVKAIFVPAQWISCAGILLIILMIYKCRDFRWLRAAASSSAVICIAVLTAVVVDWEWAFETIHAIFFRNDYWIFNSETDPIIKILPDTFFMHCGIMIAAIVLIINVAFEIIYRKKRENGKINI